MIETMLETQTALTDVVGAFTLGQFCLALALDGWCGGTVEEAQADGRPYIMFVVCGDCVATLDRAEDGADWVVEDAEGSALGSHPTSPKEALRDASWSLMRSAQRRMRDYANYVAQADTHAQAVRQAMTANGNETGRLRLVVDQAKVQAAD